MGQYLGKSWRKAFTSDLLPALWLSPFWKGSSEFLYLPTREMKVSIRIGHFTVSSYPPLFSKMLQSTLIHSPAARINSAFSPFPKRCFSLHNTTLSWVSPCLCLTLAKAPHFPCSFHRGCRDDHGCLLVSFMLFHYYNVGEGKGQKVIQWHLWNVDLRMLPDETAVWTPTTAADFTGLRLSGCRH